MLDLQCPGSKALDGWFRSLPTLSDAKNSPCLSPQTGATHEIQILNNTALQGETRTGRGGLVENSEAMANCTVKDGMEQE